MLLENQKERATRKFLCRAEFLRFICGAAVDNFLCCCDAVAKRVHRRSVIGFAADAHTAHALFNFYDGDNVAERADNCFLNLVAHGAALSVRAVVAAVWVYI